MSINILIIFAAFVTLCVSCGAFPDYTLEQDSDSGDECTRHDGRKGIYKKFYECEFTNQLFKVKKFEELTSYIRFYEAGIAIVCCQDEIEITSSGKRTAEEVCTSFGSKRRVATVLLNNGNNAEIGEFPHMAAIAFTSGVATLWETNFLCGGTLIHKKFVLSAAHCFTKKGQTATFVRLGRTSINLTDPYDDTIAVDVEIKNIIKHPSYKTDQKYHDIAIIELKWEVEFAPNIFPACLNINESDEKKELTVIGFGRTNRDDSSQTATWLQKAKVDELPLAECKQTLIDIYGSFPSTMKMNNGLKKTTLCASPKDMEGACEGDSGSSLSSINNGKYHIHGVVSFEIVCGHTKIPGFYTRVSSYLDWIADNSWNKI